MSNWLEPELFEVLSRTYRSRWDAVLLGCLPDGQVMGGAGAPGVDAAAGRELAIREALRWGEPCFELTAAERLVWAVPVMDNAQLRGGLVVELPARRAYGGFPLHAATADLLALATEANLTNAALLAGRRAASGRERRRAEAIHEAKRQTPYDLRRMYLLEEPALTAAIRRGDRGEARELLNRLLTGIHHAAGERLAAVKSYYLELITVLGRTAVESGGAPETLLEANLAALAALPGIGDPVELAQWLRARLEQVMDAVETAVRRDPAVPMLAAIAYLREHYAEPLTRDRVAAVAHLSGAHFSREFHRRFGRTFSAHLSELRVERAAELLRRTDQPVGLIALAAGFGDQSYFTKVFRRAKGRTPAAYRREARAEGGVRPAAGDLQVG